ncbi:MAG: glycosyltransferase family 2 protein [Methylovulum sp.]|nr:glycosyltransferase family 2 protein [Methylovulum sp.]
MPNETDEVFFSIIIPTRNRPELFLLALKSVYEQTFAQKEIIIINDGSISPFLEQYKLLERHYPDIQFHYLVHRPNGHGQSYSMNYGADLAKGKYLCFLDDDDYWTDNQYLQKAHSHISTYHKTVDLFYSNQKAYFSNGEPQNANVWIEDLIPKAKVQARAYKETFIVDTHFLLSSGGFAHLNCSIFNNALYHAIGGMDEGIRYECDRDIYIRAIDTADNILYNPDFISKHHIPDKKKADNMSTMISIYEKKLFQLRVYDKGILLSKNPEITAYCKIAKGYELKHITEALYKAKRKNEAFYYAKEALGVLPTIKWLSFTLSILYSKIFCIDIAKNFISRS